MATGDADTGSGTAEPSASAPDHKRTVRPADLRAHLDRAARTGKTLRARCEDRFDITSVPVIKGIYGWDDYEREYIGETVGKSRTTEAGDPQPMTDEEKTDALGFDPDRMDEALSGGNHAASVLEDVIEERTVNVDPDLDEDAFFSTADGRPTLVNRYDLEKAVPQAKKSHFREEQRYWVNEPYAFIIIFHSTKENETKYYAVQPYLTRIERDLQEFLTGKLRTSIKYADESIAGGDEAFRESVIHEETTRLLDRYDLVDDERADDGLLAGLADGVADGLVALVRDLNDRTDRLDLDPERGHLGRLLDALGYSPTAPHEGALRGIAARPEPAVLAENRETLTEYQVEKLRYILARDFIGYERIDPIKHDINVEDISCDGYDSPVFVYHSEYEQIITNIHHGTTELDDFVVKLAQRSGKGISKRRPQVDATLPDGSRAQLTLGREVSDHGTNYTIRQFNDVPFTPIDLINWKTFSLDQMAFLWLCIENHKSLLFAGGTASGKTTSLNAVSLFIPSNAKIVSIEDTREVELPQRNWIASVTRPSFSDDDKGDVDEFDLLEAALRQRPDYIVMGEIRGEEGRTAFQVMSTGHTTYTTFHADSVGEVLKRFTTDPINVSKTMFTALDLVSVQSSTRVQGRKVRRNKSLTEINHYDAENDEINVQDVYQWQAETDEFLQMGASNTLEEIMFDRGWNRETLDEELRLRRIILAYLIDRGLNTYAEVAATFQAFINDPETVLALLATDKLERSLEDLREMESVLIDVDPDTEAQVPRPDPDEDGRAEAKRILADAESLFDTYRGETPDSVAEALLHVEPDQDVTASPGASHETLESTAQEADELDQVNVGSVNVKDQPTAQPTTQPTAQPGSEQDGLVAATDSNETADFVHGSADKPTPEGDEDDVPDPVDAPSEMNSAPSEVDTGSDVKMGDNPPDTAEQTTTGDADDWGWPMADDTETDELDTDDAESTVDSDRASDGEAAASRSGVDEPGEIDFGTPFGPGVDVVDANMDGPRTNGDDVTESSDSVMESDDNDDAAASETKAVATDDESDADLDDGELEGEPDDGELEGEPDDGELEGDPDDGELEGDPDDGGLGRDSEEGNGDVDSNERRPSAETTGED